MQDSLRHAIIITAITENKMMILILFKTVKSNEKLIYVRNFTAKMMISLINNHKIRKHYFVLIKMMPKITVN
jgi:hypothetical protein